MKLLLALYLSVISFTTLSSQLETNNYNITVTVNCMEGNVTCDKVTYEGVNKNNGKSITLNGATWHTYSEDGTPSRFLGYRFKSGNIDYLVSESGKLSVIRNKTEVLLEESGAWSW